MAKKEKNIIEKKWLTIKTKSKEYSKTTIWKPN